jgi:hypothetical protein
MTHRVCRLCNGLQAAPVACPICFARTEPVGRLEDLFGPYAPYSSLASTPDQRHDSWVCVHVVACPHCGRVSYVPVHLTLQYEVESASFEDLC